MSDDVFLVPHAHWDREWYREGGKPALSLGLPPADEQFLDRQALKGIASRYRQERLPDSLSAVVGRVRAAWASRADSNASLVHSSATAWRTSSAWVWGAMPPTGWSRSRLVGKA